jgi:hypothetical protein
VEDSADCFIGVCGFLTLIERLTAAEQPDVVVLRPSFVQKRSGPNDTR